MTIAQMKELSIKKWEFLVKNHFATKDELKEAVPELKEHPAQCPFCAKYRYKYNCGSCPIKIKYSACFDSDHPYKIYWCARRTTQFLDKSNNYEQISVYAATQKILDLIKNIKVRTRKNKEK
ncbi:MAG: hypothetical protein M0R17_06375 [Candidatus Omnitrophica bacterium]|jgi:hypothetical protein|nr:hypothetical protein [Candidatus Omnitrophota bacterium]